MMEKLVEWTVLAGETAVLGENVPQRHFVQHKSHLPDTGANPSRRGGKPATKYFSYGATHLFNYVPIFQTTWLLITVSAIYGRKN
jgi:hypothetical protein